MTITEDVHITFPPGDDRYLDAVMLIDPGLVRVNVHARGESYPSEYHATHRLWADDDRTILLLGDTYFTDTAIEKIARFGKRTFQGFGRHRGSQYTGCKYGEMWAASWWPEHIKTMDEHLAKIKSLRERGIITRPTGWMLLRAWQGTDLAKHRCLPEWMTTIDDLTDDFDFPQDYDNHPVTKKAVRKMEAGKGHAARNANLPALLARLGVEARHVLHVGAHDGEEVPYYESAKFKKITLVEPDPDLARRLVAKFPNTTVVEAAAGERAGRATLFKMAVSNMNTMMQGGLDNPVGTVDVDVVRMADIATDANVAVVDVQGAELDALRGADLSRYDIVMVETTTVPDVTMASTYSDVTAHMIANGFKVEEYWTRDYQWVAKWGRKRNHTQQGEVRDVIYVKDPAFVKPAAAPEPAAAVGTKRPRKKKSQDIETGDAFAPIETPAPEISLPAVEDMISGEPDTSSTE